jgi:hypothetical protein
MKSIDCPGSEIAFRFYFTKKEDQEHLKTEEQVEKKD